MRRFEIGVGALLLFAAPAACSSVFAFSGIFTEDDNLRLISYSVQNTAEVTIFTTSFANGGFAPLLTLFDANGNFLFSDSGLADNDCVHNGVDAATGACYDSRLSWNSVAGAKYLVALTEYDNFAVGPTLADGFSEQGNGNFTAKPPFNPVIPGASFLLPGPTQRTSRWALTLTSADSTLFASTVFEPGTTILCLAGMALIAGWKRASKQRN